MGENCLISQFDEFLDLYGQCDNKLVSLSMLERELPSYRTRKFVYQSREADNSVELLLARVKIFDPSSVDLETMFVCQEHVNRIIQWEPKNPTQCNFDFRHESTESQEAESDKSEPVQRRLVDLTSRMRLAKKLPVAQQFVNKDQSEALLIQEGRFFPVGTAICKRCASYAKSIVKKEFYVSFRGHYSGPKRMIARENNDHF